MTETAWIYLKPPYPTDLFEIMYIDGRVWQSFVASGGYAGVCNPGSLWWWNSSVTLCTPNTVKFYTWNFVVFSVNGTSMRACINMQCTSKSISIGGPIQAVSSWNIGGPYHQYFNGSMADIQIYNTSLTTSEIQALYQEGIGGAPIDLQHLVAWWPLNGNANDYSGNGNNGVPTNVKFVSNWWQGYTPP
ncbi:MAG: LamG-like jellyroll fold domain-containing protein [Candidatus Micrarchaeia archaeon]